MRPTKLLIMLLAGLVVLALPSCDIHTSDNGDFDGYWHLTRVDTLQTGNSCDMSGHRVFWGVQGALIEAVDHDNDSTHYGYLFYFTRDGESLRLYNAHCHMREEGDPVVEDPSVLSPLGINALDAQFNILTLNRNRMVLEDAQLRLSFRKQ